MTDCAHKAGPGRPRSFDRDAALDAALRVFWDKGYEAASLDDLTAAMGLSRSSFYACFRSKRDTLLAALAAYGERSAAALGACADGAPCAERGEALMGALSGKGHEATGCFVANCLAEVAPHDPEVAALGRRHLERVEALVADAAGCGPDDARAALALALGVTLMRKAGADPAAVDAALARAGRLLRPEA